MIYAADSRTVRLPEALPGRFTLIRPTNHR